MFELEKLEKEIDGISITVEELDYIQESQFGEIFYKIQKLEKQIIAMDSESEDYSIQVSGLNTEIKKLMLEAYIIPTITIDEKVLTKKQIPKLLKKLGEFESLALYFDIVNIGNLSEEEEKK